MKVTDRLVDRVLVQRARFIEQGYSPGVLAVFGTDRAIAQLREECRPTPVPDDLAELFDVEAAPARLGGEIVALWGMPFHSLGDADGYFVVYVGVRIDVYETPDENHASD